MASDLLKRMRYIDQMDLETGVQEHDELAKSVFKTFLRLKAMGKNVEMSSAPLLKNADELWHEMIWTDTRAYMQLCEACAGEFIHHIKHKHDKVNPKNIEKQFIDMYTHPSFADYRTDLIDAYVAGYQSGLKNKRKRVELSSDEEDEEFEEFGCGCG